MHKGTRMTGVRLGLTYAAALVVLGLLIAMVAAPVSSQTRVAPPEASRDKSFIGIRLERTSAADMPKTTRRDKSGFTAVPERPRVKAAGPATTDRSRNPG